MAACTSLGFCLERVAFHAALFFSSLSFSFAMLRCFEWIRFVEGLASSTRAKTRLWLTFAASFLFHSSSAFLSAGLILRYRNAICLMRFMLEP